MGEFLFGQVGEQWQKPCLAGIAALTTILAACGTGSPSDPAAGNGDSPPDPDVVSCTPSGSVAGWRFTRFGVARSRLSPWERMVPSTRHS